MERINQYKELRLDVGLSKTKIVPSERELQMLIFEYVCYTGAFKTFKMSEIIRKIELLNKF